MHAAQQRSTAAARCCTAHLATPTVLSRMQHRGCPVQRCQAAQVESAAATEEQQQLSRRGALAAGVAASVASMLAAYPAPSAAVAAAAATDSFFKYSPTADKTPSIRAGVIKPPFYTMQVPAGFKEKPIPNILTGNFCMPGCGEPWAEVVFENPSEGKIQLLVSPLVKLTNKVNAAIQDLGTPESILPRIGPYITGTYYEEEDLVAASSKTQDDGLTYYYYELYSPAANGHSLTAVTTKGEGCYLFVCSASDKVWRNGEAKLRQAVEAFRV